MAKPILHIQITSVDRVTQKLIDDIDNTFKEKTNNEYHILISHIHSAIETSFKVECLNDCKGLPDVDIEALIKSINHDTVPRG